MLDTVVAVEVQLEAGAASLELEWVAAPGVEEPPVGAAEHGDDGRDNRAVRHSPLRAQALDA